MPDTRIIDPVSVRWSRPAAERGGHPLVVLLHGYGSDERDLFSLVPHLPEAFTYAAVRAPLKAPEPLPGYSWYPIEGLDGRDTTEVTRSALRLVEWIDAATDVATIGLLGFSQGGAIALQALRLRPQSFAFALNISGYVTPGALEGDDELRTLRPPVFWGRGLDDAVIPEALIEHTERWLPEHATPAIERYPHLAHGISPEELQDISGFLQRFR